MTTTNNMVAKIAAAVAGLGLVFASFAPMASAQSNEAMEAQIAALMAQIAALQSQTGSSASASMTFSRDLTIGASGADVTALQNWLIKGGYAIPAGATGYFGAQTAAALAKYQAANMISPAAGYFGPITRAKVNASAGGSTGGSDDDDDDDDDNDNGDLEGGEASLEDLEINDGEDDDAEEGKASQVAEIEFDVEDGDIKIDRVDLQFTVEAGAGEEDPWEVFETVTLYDEDGEELASEDVSDENDWLDEDDGVFRFTGLDYVVREGEMAQIVVEVEVNDGALDDAEDTWTLTVEDEGIRGVDGEDIQQYTDGTDSISFDVVEEGADDDLELNSSSEDPESTTLEAEDNGVSDWFTVFAFELEADEDSSDVELNELVINFDTGSNGADDAENVINDVMLVIDGEEFDDYDFNDIDTEIASTTFDIDGDFTVASGETVVVEVMVEFKDSDTFGGSGTIQASVAGADIDAEGADDITVTGTVTGEEHQIVEDGITAMGDGDENDAERTFVADDAGEFDQGEFTIVFEVTAIGDDMYIDKSTPVEDNDGTYAATSVSYSISNPGSNSSVGTLSATGGDYDEETNSYRIDEGDTAEFTLTVTATATADSSAEVTLEAIGYALTDVDGTTVYTVPDEPEFQTNSITLLAA